MCTGPPRCANASKPVSASWRFCRAIARISTPSKRPSPSSRATCGEPRRARVNAWKALSPKAYNALQPKTPATGLPIAASRLVLNDYAYRCNSPGRPNAGPGTLAADTKVRCRSLALRSAEGFQVPAIVVADVGPEAAKRFFEFFTVPIRNKNTRIAYYHAIGRFLSWLTEKGVLAMNPAREVKTAKFSRTEGKTPAFSNKEVRRV